MRANSSRLNGLALIVLLLFDSAGVVNGQSDFVPTEREQYQCDEEEELLPKLARMAGVIGADEGQERFDEYWANTEIVSLKTVDSRVLRGYHLKSELSTETDTLLVIQGNAWRADQFAKYAALLAENKFDVYIFDFRGYGISTPGRPTIGGVIEDYVEILGWLAARSERIFVYSFSGGGVIALSAVGKHGMMRIRRLVLDATPSKLETFGLSCLSSYDPIKRLPERCGSIAVLRGTRDFVVHKKNSIELANLVERCGGRVLSKSRGHPFQIEMPWTKKQRVKDIISLLRDNAEGAS